MSDKNPWKKGGNDGADDGPDTPGAAEIAEMAGVKDACPFFGAIPGIVPKKTGIVSSLRGGQQNPADAYDQIIQYPPCIKGGCHFWHKDHGCIIRAGLLKLAEAK